MFSGLAGVTLLLYAALTGVFGSGEKSRLHALAGGAACSVALISVLLGFNDVSKMLNILMRPYSGLSSALISQIASAVLGFTLFFKNGKKTAAGYAAILAGVTAVLCIARYYMVVTRPSLNTYLLPLILLTAAAFGVWLLCSPYKEAVFRKELLIKIGLMIISLYGVLLLLFTVRIGWGISDDRVLSLQKLLAGDYAPVFWGLCVFSFAVPFALSVVSAAKKKLTGTVLSGCSFIAGIFMLSILLNQLPVFKETINNRFLF